MTDRTHTPHISEKWSVARCTIEVRGRQGNTTWFARHILTFQGHWLQCVGIIMLDVFPY
jgi:hypothetical protein